MRRSSTSPFFIAGLACAFWMCPLSSCAQDTGGWWKSLFQGTQKSMCDSTAQMPVQEAANEAPGVMLWDEGQPIAAQEQADDQGTTPHAELPSRPQGFQTQQCDERILSLDSAWHSVDHVLRGYRVQIFSGSLQAAREVRAKARNAQAAWPVYLSSMPPNYRVTLGDFRTKWEAQQAQDTWTDEFPMSIVIPMDINLPALREALPDDSEMD